MSNKMIEFNLNQRTGEMPDLRTGDVVKVYRKIIEGGKERIQIFEGMVIAVKGKQSSSPMINVRKVSNGVGVELVLPVFSPSIEKIEVVKRAKIRRSKLYFVRERSAKSLRFKYDAVSTSKEKKAEEVKAETVTEEAVAKEEMSESGKEA